MKAASASPFQPSRHGVHPDGSFPMVFRMCLLSDLTPTQPE